MKIPTTLIDMDIKKFISTKDSLAPRGWEKPKHILDALKKRREAQKRSGDRLVRNCGTGAGGFQPGNDCSAGDGSGKDDSSIDDSKPIDGLPQKPIDLGGEWGVVTPAPFEPARAAARAYMERAGLPYEPVTEYVRVDKERAGRIAEAFDQMEDTFQRSDGSPPDPEVLRAYDAMIDETIAQYEEMLKTGIRIEFAEPGTDPYPNPRMATEDVRRNNRLIVFPTVEGFGSDASFDASKNPLLRDTGIRWGGKPVLANDVFRAVHDYFGHIKEGNGFRADGEENAWRSHSAMYSPLARRAMTTETRGQNSWVNFGPNGERNRTAITGETVFAQQKIGLLPEWVVSEGSGQTRRSKRAKVRKESRRGRNNSSRSSRKK